MTLVRWTCLLATIASACSVDDAENQGACTLTPAELLTRAAALPDWPRPLAPGLAGPAIVLDRVVDPDPSTRGEHVVYELDDCATTLLALPALPATPTTPSTRTIGALESDRTRAGLVIMGSDLADDVPIWDDTLRELDVRADALTTPTRADAEAAIAQRCRALPDRGLLVLVLAGQGTPGDGGALVLSSIDDATGTTPEAIGYRRVESLLNEHCRHAAVLWIVDASHFALEATGTSPVFTPAGPPLLVVRASDRQAIDAARASAHGPGLLGSVLATEVPPARASMCAPGRLDNAEIVALVRDLDNNRGLLAALLEARWQAFGAPAIAALEATSALTPTSSERLRTTLASAIPRAPILARGTMPAGDRCRAASECDMCETTVCQTAACSNGICRVRPFDGSSCDDDNDCTSDDRCNRGVCAGDPRPCDDGNPCTEDACEPGSGCVADPAPGLACDDGNPCTSADACTDDGACTGVGRVCDDGDPCTVDRCDAATGCVFVAQNLPCDDGDPCTLADQCRSLVCSGTRRTCTDGNDCTADRCDAETGACRFDPVADLAGCDDGDPCTTLDRCREGVCVGLAATCDDGLACTFDSCEAGTCRHLPAPGLCLSPDGAACVAVGQSPPSNPCLVCAATDRLAPTRDGQACPSDGIACTLDVCAAGQCTHRDAADSCHGPDGRCVATGELVTPCLVCQGNGVVTAVDANTPCNAACAGSCDAVGNCVCP